MKNTFLRSKEKASRTTDTRTEAPNEYASDQLQAGVDEVGHDAGQIAVSTSDFAFRKGREAVQRRRAKTKDGQEPTQHPFDIPQADSSQRLQPTEGNRRPKTRDNFPRRARQRESQNRANGLKRLTGTQSSAPRWRGSLKKYEPSCRPLSVEDSYPSIEPWKSELRPERGIFAPEILPPAPTLPLYGRTTQFDTFRRDRRCP